MTIAIGPGIGITFGGRRAMPFEFISLADRLLIDASTIVGVNGEHLATISDASPAGSDYTQAADANRPTLNTADGQSIDSSGSQWANRSSGIVTGLSSFTVCWAGSFSSTGNKTAIFFGDNTVGNGFDWSGGRAGGTPVKFGPFVRAVEAVQTDMDADTGEHFAAIRYNAAGGATKWRVTIDGVARTLTHADAILINPTAASTLCATNSAGTFGMAGKTRLIFVVSRELTDAEIIKVRNRAKENWAVLP